MYRGYDIMILKNNNKMTLKNPNKMTLKNHNKMTLKNCNKMILKAWLGPECAILLQLIIHIDLIHQIERC